MDQGPRHLLLIDDDEAVCSGLALAFGDAGWQVATASTPLSAILSILDQRLDAMVLDIHLGTSHGLTLLPRLRALAPQAHVVAITGRPSAALLADLREAGVDVLVKPFATTTLESSLDDPAIELKTRDPLRYPIPSVHMQLEIETLGRSTSVDPERIYARISRIHAFAKKEQHQVIEALTFALLHALDPELEDGAVEDRRLITTALAHLRRLGT